MSAKVCRRRQLRFETLDEALAEARRLVASERAGRLERRGNWTLGQALGHLAYWANVAFDGYPPEVRPPWLIRSVVRLFRGRILEKGMMTGVKIGRVPGGTLGTEMIDADEGLRRIESAFERLGAAAPSLPNVLFGPLTHEQWIKLNLRHAELHLSFLEPT